MMTNIFRTIAISMVWFPWNVFVCNRFNNTRRKYPQLRVEPTVQLEMGQGLDRA